MEEGRLKFFLFGIARSGTTAMANAINLHEKVMCGIENFSPKQDHSTIVVPDDFLDPYLVGGVRARKNREKMAAGPPLVYGNKAPRYYCYIDDIFRQTCADGFGIYRENLGFLPSWERRAADGDRWPKGRKSIAGILEYFLFFSSIFRASADVRIYSYSNLFFDNLDVFEMLLSSLNVHCTDAHKRKFEETFFRNQFIGKKVRILSALEEEIRGKVDIEVIDSIMKENCGEWFSTYKSGLRPHVQKARSVVFAELPEWMRRESQEVRSYVQSQMKVYKEIDAELAGAVAASIVRI